MFLWVDLLVVLVVRVLILFLELIQDLKHLLI